MHGFLLGSDPEIFLKDKSGKLISSIGKIGGTKKQPRITNHGSVQEDNVLLEFNSKPSATVEEFIENHKLVMDDITTIIKPLDLSVSVQPTGVFDDDQLDHAKAKAAGCEPDFNAWSLSINNPPDLGATNLRSGAGHIHISLDYLDSARNRAEAIRRANVVKACDIAAALPSVVMDPDSTRRSLYGKAGCHRPKFMGAKDPFNGIEYRTLSNFWLRSDETLRWAFEAIKMGLERTEEFMYYLEDGALDGAEIQRIINESDVEAAQSYCADLNLLVA